MTDTSPLHLGVTYWSRRTAYRQWEAFDRSAVRDELAHLAALGCNAVRFVLRWEDLQPRADRIHTATLHAFEQALDAAADAGLAATTVLLPVAIGGGLHLPAWVNTPDPFEQLRDLQERGVLLNDSDQRPPIISGWRYGVNEAPNLFADTRTRSQQRMVIEEVIGNLGTHPAAYAWQLGEGLEYVAPPESRSQSRDWLQHLAEAARGVAAQVRLCASISPRGLLNANGPRPEDGKQIVAESVLDASVLPPIMQTSTPNRAAIPFLYAVAAELAGHPVGVAGIGIGSAAEGQHGSVQDVVYGRTRTRHLVRAAEQAEYVGRLLETLWHAGAPALWLTAYADYPRDAWRVPPLDQAPSTRTHGLVDAQGREKPLAEAVRAFAQQSQLQRQSATPTLQLDPERYWHNPSGEFARLWREASGDKG